MFSDLAEILNTRYSTRTVKYNNYDITVLNVHRSYGVILEFVQQLIFARTSSSE